MRGTSPRMTALPGLAFEAIGRQNFDAEAAEADVIPFAAGQEPDRGNAEVLEDLSAESDLTPLARARRLRGGAARLRDGARRHAGGAVTQEHQHAASFVLEARQGGMDGLGA